MPLIRRREISRERYDTDSVGSCIDPPEKRPRGRDFEVENRAAASGFGLCDAIGFPGVRIQCRLLCRGGCVDQENEISSLDSSRVRIGAAREKCEPGVAYD